MRATMEESCTIQQRLTVHRAVEWLADRIACTADADGELPSLVEVCREAGIAIDREQPATERLFREELLRAIVRREEVAMNSGWFAQNEPWEEVFGPQPERVSDPYGELAGGRVGTSHLIGRRTDETANLYEEVGEVRVDLPST